MYKRLLFPMFNGLICAAMGALIGYLIGRPAVGVAAAAVFGMLAAGLLEVAFARLDRAHWLYRRRALLLALVEIPFAMFVAGPYAYVAVELEPHHYQVCCETPLDYGAASYEDVQLQAADGIILKGWFVPPRQEPGAVIILLPGAGGDRRATAWHAKELIAAGYGVLMYDPRGLGESAGASITLGWEHRGDLPAAAAYLQSLASVDDARIAVLGLSRGAHIAVNAAYLQPDCFAALWLDGLGAQRMSDYPGPRDGVEKFERALNAAVLKMGELEAGEPLPPSFGQMLKELDRPPLMLVASGLQDFERRTYEGYLKLHGPSQTMWLIENAPHTGGPGVMPDEYRRRMLQFFDQAFKRPAGKCEGR